MNLGKAIKLCRTQRNLTRAQVAAQAGISVSYLSLLENNRRDPAFSTIEHLCHALRIPAFILMFLAEGPAVLEAINPDLAGTLARTSLTILQTHP